MPNWWAREGKTRLRSLRSAWSREKKKLAPNEFSFCKRSAIVRETVVFPVPAWPQSQKMRSCLGIALTSPWIQEWTSSSSSTRVPSKHRGRSLLSNLAVATWRSPDLSTKKWNDEVVNNRWFRCANLAWDNSEYISRFKFIKHNEMLALTLISAVSFLMPRNSFFVSRLSLIRNCISSRVACSRSEPISLSREDWTHNEGHFQSDASRKLSRY